MDYEKTRNGIWNGMYKSSCYKWQCLRYLDRCQIKAIIYDVVVISFPFISGILMSMKYVIPAIVLTIIIGVLEILKHFTNDFVKSKEQIAKIKELADYYNKLFFSFKKLWYESECKGSIDVNMYNQFYSLSEDFHKKEVELNDLTPRLSKKENLMINKKANLDISEFVSGEKEE